MLQIQLNTDNHIDGTDALESRVTAMLEQSLGRFSSRISRIEVFLSDSNSTKGGADDKRCALEARLENDDPLGASHDDEDPEGRSSHAKLPVWRCSITSRPSTTGHACTRPWTINRQLNTKSGSTAWGMCPRSTVRRTGVTPT